ncbi:MAG TPA: anti-sigma factor domain-containing protein [Massilibacterium sp.]|nr:anti-sigma factor domain-containing protein [Massilibacterium sp.]
MQRGIIVEVKKRNAIILTKDGTIQKVKLAKNHHPMVGEEMLVMRPKPSPLKAHYAIFPFAFLFFIVLFGKQTIAPEVNPVMAYVNFDGPGSVEIGVDDKWNVVTMHAYDQIGNEIIQQLPNKPTLDDIPVQFSNNETVPSNIFVTTTLAKEQYKEIVNEKLTRIDEREQELVFVIRQLQREKRKEALKKGLSPGKYVTFLESRKDYSFFNDVETKEVFSPSYFNLERSIFFSKKDQLVTENSEW